MKKVLCDKASRKHTYIMALGTTVLLFLMLVSIAGAVPFADIQNSGSNNVSNFNKFDEAINAYEKAMEINPQNSLAMYDLKMFIPPSTKRIDRSPDPGHQ